MDSNILYLLKIGKKEYLNETILKGHFYMNTCECFRKMAIDVGGDLVGDLQECSFPQGTELKIGEVSMKPFDKNDSESSAMCCGANYCIYCTYAVLANALPNSAIIPSNVFAGIIGDNDASEYGVLLFKKPAAIVKRFITELSIRGLSGRSDLVSYDGHEFYSPYQFLSKEYILDLCFHKRKEFEEQKEYRIATINKENAEIKDLCTGKLEDDEYEMISVQPEKALHITTDKNPSNVTFLWL